MIFRATVSRVQPIRKGATTVYLVLAQAGPVVVTIPECPAPAPQPGQTVDLDLTETQGIVSAVAGWTAV